MQCNLCSDVMQCNLKLCSDVMQCVIDTLLQRSLNSFMFHSILKVHDMYRNIHNTICESSFRNAGILWFQYNTDKLTASCTSYRTSVKLLRHINTTLLQ